MIIGFVVSAIVNEDSGKSIKFRHLVMYLVSYGLFYISYWDKLINSVKTLKIG